jgi:hypothetical protein
MSAFWLCRLSRRTPVSDVRPGSRYRRQLGKHLAATATVLELRTDLVGIPHVEFAVTVDGSAARLSEGDTRVLALQSFLDTYREPLAPEVRPDRTGIDGVTVIRLLPRPAAL